MAWLKYFSPLVYYSTILKNKYPSLFSFPHKARLQTELRCSGRAPGQRDRKTMEDSSWLTWIAGNLDVFVETYFTRIYLISMIYNMYIYILYPSGRGLLRFGLGFFESMYLGFVSRLYQYFTRCQIAKKCAEATVPHGILSVSGKRPLPSDTNIIQIKILINII